MKVENEKNFGIPSEAFAISPSETDYTLYYSVDGEHFDTYAESIPAGENAYIKCGIAGLIYKLSGISGNVYVKY